MRTVVDMAVMFLAGSSIGAAVMTGAYSGLMDRSRASNQAIMKVADDWRRVADKWKEAAERFEAVATKNTATLQDCVKLVQSR